VLPASCPASIVVTAPHIDWALASALAQSEQEAQANDAPPEKMNDALHAPAVAVVHSSYVWPSLHEPTIWHSLCTPESPPVPPSFMVVEHVFVSWHGSPESTGCPASTGPAPPPHREASA
jgi:hypothetical protein